MHLNKLIAVATTVLAAGQADAANVIAQNAPVRNFYLASFLQPGLAQSFVQSAPDVTGAGVFLESSVGTTGSVTISLWTARPNAQGAAQLASASAAGTAGTWVDVFWAPVSVIPTATYFLVFTGSTSLGIAGDISNGYAFGNMFANAGYAAFSNFDYAFRTYATEAVADVVPEPASWALLIAGFGLTGAVMRSRRRRLA